MLRGNLPAKMDPKGRLKVPASFRKLIDENYGNRVFITSLNGDCVRIYPFPVWEEIEEQFSAPPTMNPVKMKFMDMTNYWGQEAEVDGQGRVLIHQHLRSAAKINAEVAVMGRITYLEIWDHATFRQEKIDGKSFSDSDLEVLAQLGI